tara:strand:- start:1759 stop:2628 length:870 start_codon:yes stop_codon:yes gene_type:complete
MATQVGDPLAQESTLSNWAGPYVTDMLGRGRALANEPYQGYGGALTAGQSSLQTDAFQGLGALSTPTGMGAYTPQSFTGAGYAAPTAQQAVDGQTGTYNPASDNTMQQYMTPYLQGALQPQYDAASRQALIAQQAMQSQYGKAGAYGGGRQAVADAELARGALDRMAGITGTGYQNAFNQAQQQFNTEQNRNMSAQDQTNRFGFDVFNAQQGAGAIQRGIQGEQVAADRAQFAEERDDPYKKVQYMQSMLQGLPIETQSYEYAEPSTFTQGVTGAGGVLGILERMGLLG